METFNKNKNQVQLTSPKTNPVLPPELWNHIFQYLGHEDLFSVHNTCSEWYGLLKEKRTSFLFHMVIPLVMGHVERKTFYKCRAVNKSGKISFDKTLQGFCYSDDINAFALHHEDSITQRRLREVACKLKTHYDFGHANPSPFLQRVLPDFETVSSKINPFLFHHILLVTRNGNEDLQGPGVLRILPKFGHHLVSLHCILRADTVDILFSNTAFQLSLVPNLKRLMIYPVVAQTGNMSILKARPSASYNFPNLVSLVRFNAEDVQVTGELFCYVLTVLEKYGQQLTSFSCAPTLLTLPFLSVKKLNSLFSNIKKFELTGAKLDFPRALIKLSELSWSLEYLHLKVSYLTGWKEVNMLEAQNVFSAVNNFHQSLVHLHLDCLLLPIQEQSNVDNDNEFEQEYKPMSKLKIIVTNSHNMNEALFRKFLQENCRNLQQLHIETWDIQCREMGRWALEHVKNLEKVVFWNLKVSTFDEFGRTHTMRHARQVFSAKEEADFRDQINICTCSQCSNHKFTVLAGP